MTPLYFILLLTGVLILLIYWSLAVLGSKDRARRVWPAREFDFEAGQELFKYLPPERTRPDSLHLTSYGKRILVSWQLSKPSQVSGPLVIRIYDSEKPDRYYAASPDEWEGNFQFKARSGVAYYAAAGIEKEGEFNPILTSAPIVAGTRSIVH